MTLVACMEISGIPIIVGDILLTWPKPAQGDVHVPTFGRTSDLLPASNGRSVAGVTQKLFQVGPNIMLGFAGVADTARYIAKEMIELDSDDPFNLHSFRDYLIRLKSRVNNDLSLVGYFQDNKDFYPVGLNCVEIDFHSPHVKNVFAAGSGIDELKRYLESFKSTDGDSLSKGTQMTQALIQSLMMTAYFMRGELLGNVDTLSSYFGGFYEIAAPQNGRWQKLQNVTYLFWQAKADPENQDGVYFSLPEQAIKVEYLDDILVVRSTQFSEGSSPLDRLTKDRVFYLSPVYRNLVKNEISVKMPSLRSEIIWNYIVVEMPDDSAKVAGIWVHSKNNQGEIRILDTDEGSRLEVDFTMMQKIRSAVRHLSGIS